jgi:hypothetical protein
MKVGSELLGAPRFADTLAAAVVVLQCCLLLQCVLLSSRASITRLHSRGQALVCYRLTPPTVDMQADSARCGA